MAHHSSAKKIAILKPDHMGDLILSVPAIRAVLRTFPDATLICDPLWEALAQYLFPSMRVLTIRYPHLQKGDTTDKPEPPLLPGGPYDVILSLRSDGVIDLYLLRESASAIFSNRGDFSKHETLLHKEQTQRITGPYSRTRMFFGDHSPRFPTDPGRIGLCISAGFAANRWPNSQWLELGLQLLAEGRQLLLVGGPQEEGELRWLGQSLKLGSDDILIGSTDFAAFLKTLTEKTDLIVATDSGTAHLCSLTRPVLSLFGPSPFRRFAPFGRHNKVLSYDLSCSPCPQFDKRFLNLCVSRECLTAISAQDVRTAILRPANLARGKGLRLIEGVSHLDEFPR